MHQRRELVVIGAGPAGLTAGLYGARAGLRTVVLDTKSPGGQILLTDCILHYLLRAVPSSFLGLRPNLSQRA